MIENDLEKLQRAILEQKESAKLLIRRDLELNRANEKLRELDQTKSHFISVVAHQLRTPLSSIKWSLDMVLGEALGTLNDEQKTFLRKCYESNERLIVMINDMLGADHIDSGKMKYSLEPKYITDLVDNTLFEMSPMITKKNLKVIVGNKDNNMPKVLIDEEKIKAVLQNILENAIKYTPNEGMIEVDFQKLDNSIQVSVKDSGIGIPEEEQKNVFNRFFRARNAIKMVTDGSGLGLYIAKGIVEKHGGKIWFKSKLGEGSTFAFTVPQAP